MTEPPRFWSPDIEAHRNDERQFVVRNVGGRCRHRLGANQHSERFLIERCRSRALHDAARQQPALTVDREGDRRDPLLTARAGFRRVALETFDMGGKRGCQRKASTRSFCTAAPVVGGAACDGGISAEGVEVGGLSSSGG
jgi:hypothetical protein